MPVFEIGNKAALKWDEDTVRDIFNKMIKNTKNDDNILCIQDAIMSVDLYPSSVNYLVDKFPVFESLKSDINNIIIARINRGALKGDFNPTASIWRMKQSGEKDSSEVNHQNNGSDFKTNVTVLDNSQATVINDLLSKFKDE